MIDTTTVNVNIRWDPQEGFFLWGTRHNGGICDAYDLRDWLFAWHEPSFYGTFIEITESMNVEGLFLPALEALDYLAEPALVKHQSLDFSSDWKALSALAPLVKEALIQGHFMPDFAKWKAGELGWKLQLPESAAAWADMPLAKQWIDRLIPAWTREDGVMRQSLERLERSFPLLHRGKSAADVWMDEEDWLISIGWQSDGTPFRTCLKLEEPASQGGLWPLRIVLQDRSDKDLMFEVSTDTVNTWMPESAQAIQQENLPEAWQPYLSRAGRDADKWRRMLPILDEGDSGLRSKLSPDEAWELLTKGSLRLMEAGYSVFLPVWWERIRKWRPKLKAKVKSSVGSGPESMFGLNQLMQFDWKIALGDIELTETEFRELLEQNKRLVQIRGQWVQLDPAQLAKIQQVMNQVQKKQGLSFRDVLELHLLGSSEGEEEQDFHRPLPMEVELNDQLLELVDLLNHAKRPPLTEPPDNFRGTLRPYQIEGISWLIFLRDCGLGGCLADDMGLGKTIQMISYLLLLRDRHLKQSEPEPQAAPSLLICPTSVLGNWQKELQRFAPDLRVYLHYGPARSKGEAFKESCSGYDLVLTTYTLSHLDETELASVEWDCICLDEAQNIKNAYTKQATSIRSLPGKHRIAMTGTPIENRLTELWSIFDFLNPGYLGSLRDFTQNFVNAIERTQDQELVAKMQRLIRPFLLRRVKSDPTIELDLPDKYEYKTYISLTAEQATLYENYIQNMFDRLDKLSTMERRGLILAALTKLKQICNHPSLLNKESVLSPWQKRSNKVERLLEMVHELRQEGDKCLIFTQFVETGRLLQRILEEELGGKVPFLHGGTAKIERDRMIESFQTEPPEAADSGVFLLSLKAGGTGLNLTAANHVFHFDRWWNPAVENQATDRAFRIGQTRHVQVHKFITLGTLEERIDEMIDKKLGLSQQIVGSGEQWITELSTEDLKDLFALRSEWVDRS